MEELYQVDLEKILRKKLSGRKIYILISILFLISLAMILYDNFFLKKLQIYPDELRYLHINDSIFNDQKFLIRGIPNDFQKIMYSIVLWPASIFVGTSYYTYIIAAINSLLMSLMVPISFLLAKLCKLNYTQTILLLFIAMSTPDTMYALTFMSENLYFPLGMSIIAFTWYMFEFNLSGKKYWYHTIFLAILIFLLYLVKEVGILFLAGYIIVMFYDILKNRGTNTIIKRKVYWNIILICAIIGLIYAIAQMTVFSGMNNVYAAQLITKSGTIFERVIYCLRAMLINTTWMLLAFFFFPVVAPLYSWKRISDLTKKRYIFIISILFITMLVVVYTISLYEDFPSLVPRQHLRYLSPFFIPLVALFLQTTNSCGDYINKKVITVSSICFAISFLFLLMPFNKVTVDQTMLSYVEWINFSPRNSEYYYYFIKILVITLLFLMTILILKKKKYMTVVICSLIIFVGLVNHYQIKNVFTDQYIAKPDLVKETLELRKDVLNLNGNIIFLDSYGNGFAMGETAQYLDTYMPNVVRIMMTKSLQSYMYQHNRIGEIPVTGSQNKEFENNIFQFNTAEGLSYLIVDKDSERYLNKKSFILKHRYSNLDLALYQNLNPTSLSYVGDSVLYGDNWYNKESWGRWGKGKTQDIQLFIDSDNTDVELYLRSFGDISNVDIYFDNQFINTVKILPGAAIPYQFFIDRGNNKYVTITFVNRGSLKSPEELGINADKRKLGIGLDKILIRGELPN